MWAIWKARYTPAGKTRKQIEVCLFWALKLQHASHTGHRYKSQPTTWDCWPTTGECLAELGAQLCEKQSENCSQAIFKTQLHTSRFGLLCLSVIKLAWAEKHESTAAEDVFESSSDNPSVAALICLLQHPENSVSLSHTQFIPLHHPLNQNVT